MVGESSIKTVSAKMGSPFAIRIWEDRTRGSRWMPKFDTTSLRLLSDEFDRTRNIRVSDIGMRCFEFLPMKSGTYPVVFESRYGWKFSADQRLTYEIEVV